MKKLFAVSLLKPNSEVYQRIEDYYPDNFRYSDTLCLVAVDHPTVSQDVAVTIGIKGDDRVPDSSGVVFKLNTGYSGYTTRSLWEWLESMSDEG